MTILDPLSPDTPSGALSQLRAEFEYLSPTLQRAAKYLLKHPQKVLYQSITEVAEVCSCAESSVIRLCRELGFKGFQDFKLALSADLASAPLEAKAQPETTREILTQARLNIQTTLHETGAMLDLAQLEQAAKLIISAKQVLTVGQGASGVTGQDLSYKLLRAGLFAFSQSDPHLAAMAASVAPSESVVIGISRSGTTLDTVHTLEIARLRGCKTIAITHRGKSPITRCADVSLFSSSAEGPLSGGDIASKVGQLLIIDVLFKSVLFRHKAAAEAVQRTAAAVSGKNL